jgi:23S rRNA pseudouridine1911/1915/1917 synthase
MASPASDQERLKVEPGKAGERLDSFLARRDERFSRNRFKALIKNGRVTVGGQTLVEPNYRVNAGDEIAFTVPEPEDPTPQPEAIPLTVIFEDADLIVIDKPARLVVHPAAGNWTGTLVNALLYHCGGSLSGIGGVRRPGIVHRLDKETSGLMVVAKSDRAHRGLAAQFADHGRKGPLRRAYLALTWGAPMPAKGVIDAPLDRDARSRLKRAVVKSGGRTAVTRYETVERYPGNTALSAIAALLRCQLETGRTHQIRAHMAHIGHPLIGDPVYGRGFLTKAETLPAPLASRVRKFRRQALHAATLSFQHPCTGEILTFESPPPADMAGLIDGFRKIGG